MPRPAEEPSLAPASAGPGIGDDARAEPSSARTRPSRIGPGSSVLLLRPWKLRGTVGIVRRRMTSGWEVEIRSARGTPMHLTLPERALRLQA